MTNKKKSEKDKLNKTYSFRCNDAELENWKKSAAQHGTSIPNMMRSAMNGTKVYSKQNALAVCELRKTAILLREHLNIKNKLPHFRRISVENALEKMVTTMNILMEK